MTVESGRLEGEKNIGRPTVINLICGRQERASGCVSITAPNIDFLLWQRLVNNMWLEFVECKN